MWILVPLMPHEAHAMEMYQLEHLPIFHGDLQFQFDLYNCILAASPDLSLHAEMTAAKLNSCHKVAHNYFCSRTRFLHQCRSCAFALIHGEKELATQLCPTTISRCGQIVLLSTEKPAHGHWPRARVTAIKEAGRTRVGITHTVTVKLVPNTLIQSNNLCDLSWTTSKKAKMEWQKLKKFILLLVLLWLAMSRLILATTLQKRVGLVFSPTQFGMIHFQHQKSELVNKGKGILKALDHQIWRLNQMKNEFATTSVQEQRNHVAEVIKEIIQKVDEEMTFMGQRAASGPAREKHFLAAVIAVALAIFSFGLGSIDGVGVEEPSQHHQWAGQESEVHCGAAGGVGTGDQQGAQLGGGPDPLGLHSLQPQSEAHQICGPSPRGREALDSRIIPSDGGTADPAIVSVPDL
jgi:hypothetical protein